MPLVRSALGAVNAGIEQTTGMLGAKGAEGVQGARGASGQATPPYSDDYKKMGHEWLAIAEEIAQADRATINQLTEQYRLSDSSFSTELGKILVHTRYLPQIDAVPPLHPLITADHVWANKETIVQRLREKGNESIRVAQEIEKLNSGNAAGIEPDRKAALRTLDTGDSRYLETGRQINKFHWIRKDMGLIPAHQALESEIFNPLGDAAYALDLLALRGAIKDAGKIISAARRVDVPDNSGRIFDIPGAGNLDLTERGVAQFIDANATRFNKKLGPKIGKGELPFEASKYGVENAISTVQKTLETASDVTPAFSAARNKNLVTDVFSKETGFTVRIRIETGEFETLIQGPTQKVRP